jgi:alanine-synthesizing transaminase
MTTYRQRRDVLTKALNEMGWKVATPNATMFIWAKIPARFQSMDSLDFAKKLLTEAGVVVSPGICFGDNGEGHVRFSLVDTRERIKEGVSRIQRCLNL